MERVIVTAAVGVLAAACLGIAWFQLRGKGPVFTNAWWLATPKEREHMDKGAQYRMAAKVFGCMGGLLALVAAGVATGFRPVLWAAAAGAIGLGAYVVACAIRGELKG